MTHLKKLNKPIGDNSFIKEKDGRLIFNPGTYHVEVLSKMTPLKKLLDERPREFWVMTDDSGLHTVSSHDNNYPYKSLHVIEASYAQRLRDELERCVKALEIATAAIDDTITPWQTKWDCDVCVEINKECYQPLCEARTKINKLLGGDE